MSGAGTTGADDVEVVRLEVPADPEHLALVRMVVATTARLDPLFDEERIEDLRIIVSEAATNAIEAASAAGGDPAPTVVVECRLGPTHLEVVVRDSGSGFDPGAVTVVPPASDPERLRYERGLGLPLIRALADEVDIASGPEGTTVRVALLSDPEGLAGLA